MAAHNESEGRPAILVLSRKRDQSIVIDNGRVVVTVVEIRGDKVRLGITAEKEIPVHRDEVQRAIQEEMPRQPPSGMRGAA
jgi:carbon storage regulator